MPIKHMSMAYGSDVCPVDETKGGKTEWWVERWTRKSEGSRVEMPRFEELAKKLAKRVVNAKRSISPASP